MKKYSLIIHGGCGGVPDFSDEQKQAFKDSLLQVLEYGESLLRDGETALVVAQKCVEMLEDDPIYNAGKGSVLNAKEDFEMDASIMDGRDLSAGAVAGVTRVKNPIKAARLVRDKSSHIFLIGDGAEEFIRMHGLEEKDKEYFVTERRVKQLKKMKEAKLVGLDHGGNKEIKKGTVGAVVYDKNGDIAAATSTGGLVNKEFGRVGDSPLIGCGTYADNSTCGVSCTGVGEHFIATVLAKHVSDLILYKPELSAQVAADETIRYFSKSVDGDGGFIMIDHRGEIADAFCTDGLIRAYVREGEKPMAKLL